MPDTPFCPLCSGLKIVPYHRDKNRAYLRCGTCKLVFVPAEHHLPAIDEKAEYDLHDNQPNDPGYRKFLNRLFAPLNEHLNPMSRGLDFGCGPGPALSLLFREAGHTVALYDLFYAPDKSVLSDTYDFITLSEVAEHLSKPGKELDQLWTRLQPGGWLGIMTKRVRDLNAFKSWHYITDPTHICFFSEPTFHWIADRWTLMGTPARVIFVGDDVVLFKKE